MCAARNTTSDVGAGFALHGDGLTSDERSLAEARATFLTMSDPGFAVFDEHGRIRCLDARAHQVLTVHNSQLPKSIFEVVDRGGRQHLSCALREIAAGHMSSAQIDIEIDGPLRAIQFVRLDLSASRTSDAAAKPILATVIDTTTRGLSELQRRRDEKRLRATVDNVAVGIISTDWHGQFLEVNQRFAHMLNVPVAEFQGLNFRDFMLPEDVTEHTPRRAALWRGDIPSVTVDRRWIKRGGDIIWLRMTISVQDDLLDCEPYSVVILEDITEAKRVEESQSLLVGELNHRVKNTLAVVQGIVRRTLATAPDPETFALQVEQRLQSISRAHDMLSRSDWVDLGLVEVIQTSLIDAFHVHAGAINVAVESVQLSPHQAIMLTLILHELATNAVKYGALSRDRGRVALRGYLDRDNGSERQLRLTWRESGGPPVKPPSRSGFGQFLLMRGVTHSLNGDADMRHPASGVEFELSFPISPALNQTPRIGTKISTQSAHSTR